MEQPDLETTFTQDEIDELAEWIESLTLIDIAALKSWWEKRQACENRVQ